MNAHAHRPPQAGHTSPRWYALTTWPTKEPSAQLWFNRQGIECWFPTETAYRKPPRGQQKRIPYERRLAPGYIFARFTGEPQWDVLFRGAPGRFYLRGVVGVRSQPLPISDDALAEMRSVPENIRRIREQEADARRIRPGDKAEIKEGPLAGWVVDITTVDAGIAHFISPMMGKGKAELGKLERQT